MSRSRAHRVDLRLDDAELAALTALSEAWGCSTSDVLRRLVSGRCPDLTPESVRTPEPVNVEPVRTPRRQTGDEALAELGITPPPPGTMTLNPFAAD